MKLSWAILIVFVVVFCVEWFLYNKKPKYNAKAKREDHDPYVKMLEINEELKKNTEIDAAKTAVRNTMECLRNESAFGIGGQSVMKCEKEIAKCLNEIREKIQDLSDDKTAKEAETAIIKNCSKIQKNLTIRTELKKR